MNVSGWDQQLLTPFQMDAFIWENQLIVINPAKKNEEESISEENNSSTEESENSCASSLSLNQNSNLSSDESEFES